MKSGVETFSYMFIYYTPLLYYSQKIMYQMDFSLRKISSQ